MKKPGEHNPVGWEMRRINLGTALYDLGEREAGTQHLTEAIAAYRAALLEYTRERDPLDWAMSQNNLGAALTMLGQRESDRQSVAEGKRADLGGRRIIKQKRHPV